jgi:hypothetical protein
MATAGVHPRWSELNWRLRLAFAPLIAMRGAVLGLGDGGARNGGIPRRHSAVLRVGPGGVMVPGERIELPTNGLQRESLDNLVNAGSAITAGLTFTVDCAI